MNFTSVFEAAVRRRLFRLKIFVPAPSCRGCDERSAPVYWANDLFLRRAISLAADMAESGRTPDPRTGRHGHSRPPLSAARRTLSSPGQARLANLSVRLRRHRRARRYTLRIHPSDREAILTMPPRGTMADAKDFAQRHGGWIAARLGRLPKAAPFLPGTLVPLRGVAHRIVHRAGVARHGVDRNSRQRRARFSAWRGLPSISSGGSTII